jgi:hypothetical protein
MWQPQDGNKDAKALLTQYPSPQALRRAFAREGTALLPQEVRSIMLSPEVSIGMVVDDPAFSPRDVAWIHAGLVSAAMDYDIWTSPDGTSTVRTR